jgi:glutathione S-transferase
MHNEGHEQPYSLWWTWNSAGMSCHAALEEIGVDYSLPFIDFDEPWSEDYKALNPNLKVPTLVDYEPADHDKSQPVVIYQSAAILHYLADKHPEAKLLPAPGSRERALCYQWLSFLAEMLQPAYMEFYYPQRHTTNESGTSEICDMAVQRADELWGRIEASMSTDYLSGDTISICDLYLLPMIKWNMDIEFTSLDKYPKVMSLIHKLHHRSAVQAMLDAHCRYE